MELFSHESKPTPEYKTIVKITVEQVQILRHNLAVYTYTRTDVNSHSSNSQRVKTITMQGPTGLTTEKELLALFESSPEIIRHKLMTL